LLSESGYISLSANGNGNILFGTPTERMRIDGATGSVGISNSIPSSFNGGANNLVVGSGSGAEGMTIYGGAESNIFFADGTAGTAAYIGRIEYSHSSDLMRFYVNNLNAMTIDSSGNLLVGNTDITNSRLGVRGTVLAATLETTSTNTGHEVLVLKKPNATGRSVAFIQGSSDVGNISVTSSATTYNTSSDQRLKDNIVDAPSASDDIDAIQVRSFDWKADGEHQKYGMVAQELQAVAPEAVSAPEDPEEMMGVDYSKLVPMMLKEIQSLRARINALEAE
jgi:hypothetical protein